MTEKEELLNEETIDTTAQEETSAQEPAEATTDYSSIVREQRTRFNNQILNNAAYSALKDNVKIEDNSILFY